MARTICLVCLISTDSGRNKKAKNAALVVGTKQTLSNLHFLLISMSSSNWTARFEKCKKLLEYQNLLFLVTSGG